MKKHTFIFFLFPTGFPEKSGRKAWIPAGTNTEIGRGQADIMADRATASVSVFEQKVMVPGRHGRKWCHE